MDVGQRVEVHTKLRDTWSSGFEVASIVDGGYRLRRMSDGSLLPGSTCEADLRPAPPRPPWGDEGPDVSGRGGA